MHPSLKQNAKTITEIIQIMKKRKIQIIGISIFLMTLGMNLQYAFNNYGILSLKFNPAILASGSGGSGTGEPNYSYLAQLESVECVISSHYIAAGTIINGIPIAVGYWEYDYGQKMACVFSLFSKCDQNGVTPCAKIQ